MKALKIAALVFFGYSLIGCGANKVQSGNQSSAGTGGTGAKLYADCSGFQKTTTQGVVGTFLNGSNYVPDLIRLKLLQVDTNVTTGSNFIQIFRWSETNGTRSYNNTAVSFVAQLKSTGEYLNNGAPWDRISKANIDSIITAKNLGAQGITAANFNTYVSFVLVGMDVQYQAMTIAFYDSTVAGATAYNSIDVLLPSFDANPNTYASARSANSALPALHPNWAARSNGLSNQQYKEATAAYCAQF